MERSQTPEYDIVEVKSDVTSESPLLSASVAIAPRGSWHFFSEEKTSGELIQSTRSYTNVPSLSCWIVPPSGDSPIFVVVPPHHNYLNVLLVHARHSPLGMRRKG